MDIGVSAHRIINITPKNQVEKKYFSTNTNDIHITNTIAVLPGFRIIAPTTAIQYLTITLFLGF